jgi:hypothetical protein
MVFVVFCLFFTVKNSVLMYFFGISYERGIFWHKFLGILSVVGGVLHYFSSRSVLDGYIVQFSMMFMVLFSFYPIRIYFYAIFMKLHWIGFLVFFVGCIMHGVGLGVVGSVYWGIDGLIK